MKLSKYIFYFTFILTPLCSFGQNSVVLVGKVVDKQGAPLKNVDIRVSPRSFGDNQKTRTNISGSFYLKQVNNEIYIGANKKGYFGKHISQSIDSNRSIDTIFTTIILKDRESARILTDSISEKDLGLTVREAIKRFKLDSLECSVIHEPPGVARGIEGELSDSTMIWLHFPRQELSGNFYDLDQFMNEQVTGIALAYTNCEKKFFGTDLIWLGINYNPYCDLSKKKLNKK